MSQTNINARERATYVGLESAFGVAPSSTFPNVMTRVFPLGDALILDGLAQEMLPVLDERVRREDAIHPVHGLKIATKIGALKCLLKATKTAAQLSASGTPGSLTPRILLTHAFGAEHALAGSTVATGTSTTQFDVQAGLGVNFKPGTWLVVFRGSAEGEPAKIVSVSTDTLVVTPALGGIPSSTDVVRNLYNYAGAESHSNSLTVQQAFVGDSTAQVQATGCHGSIAFDLPECGKLPSMSLPLAAANFTGPSSQSFNVATASDEMGASFAWAPSVYLAASLDRAVTVPCEGVTLEHSNTWEMVRDPAATQTVATVVNTAGRPTTCKATIKLRFDSSYVPAFTGDTAYHFVVVQKVGTGATASFWIWELPVAQLVAQPKLSKIGERLHMELSFEGVQDTAITGTDDFALATFRVAFG